VGAEKVWGGQRGQAGVGTLRWRQPAET